nr:immunoglobulin heavy chain junction region [Macaca mulatta]MOW21208.1 immunoglobulin heavy chain junction region [Macaca mulatta]
CVRGGGDLDVW